MPELLPLSSQTETAIEAVLDAAFGADRHGRTAYAIRRGTSWLPRFSYAALRDDGRLAGLLQSWPVALGGSGGKTVTPLIMVGPVAVLPEWQGEGYGRMLMDRLITDADKHADCPLMMIGDPEYYGRFWGFSAEATGGWSAPGPVDPRRLLMRGVAGAPALPSTSAGMLGPRQPVPAAPKPS